jgi:CO/xanthine dehydrogenase Mo-binding subunit
VIVKKKGRGLAVLEYPTGMYGGGDPSQAFVKLKPDGGVDLVIGTVELGEGARTVMAQMCAETLGVPYESVSVSNGDTDTSPFDTGTFASRATYSNGNAIFKAATEAKKLLLEVASKEMEASADDLEIVNGVIQVKGAPGQQKTVAQIAGAALGVHNVFIAGRGAYLKPAAEIDEETGAIEATAAHTWGTVIADIEVDTETGLVRVERLTGSYDVGKAINPALVAGQIDGGSVMGLSSALLENLYPSYPTTDNQAPNFGHLQLATAADVPELRTAIVEDPAPNGPFGAKGVGEMTSNAIGPAIANAIYDAVGVWMTELPITPERVLRALEAKERGEQ